MIPEALIMIVKLFYTNLFVKLRLKSSDDEVRLATSNNSLGEMRRIHGVCTEI